MPTLIERIEKYAAEDVPAKDLPKLLSMDKKEINLFIRTERLGLTYTTLRTHMQQRALNNLASTRIPSTPIPAIPTPSKKKTRKPA